MPGDPGRERRPLGGDAAQAHCRGFPECHQEVEEVQPGEEDRGSRRGWCQPDEGLVSNDQKDATAPERTGKVFHTLAFGGG